MNDGKNIAIAAILAVAMLVSCVLPSLGECVRASDSIDCYITGTRQAGEVNYTQMCLDFIRETYPGKNVTLIGSYDRTDSEIGLNYTVLDADIFPGSIPGLSDSVEVSVRHDTMNFEFGLSQINNDAEAYYNSLPTPYKKIYRATRLMLKVQFSHLPTINETRELFFRTNVTFEVSSANATLLIDDIEELGYPYVLTEGIGIGNNVIYVTDITLYGALMLTDKTYVKACSFYYLYPYTPNNETGTTFIIGGGIGVGLGVLIGVLAIGIHSRNKRSGEK